MPDDQLPHDVSDLSALDHKASSHSESQDTPQASSGPSLQDPPQPVSSPPRLPPERPRSNRPTNVRLPSPPRDIRTQSPPSSYSPNNPNAQSTYFGFGGKRTPGADGMLTGGSGPGPLLSPSISSNAFIFPIRSVFQGRGQGAPTSGNDGQYGQGSQNLSSLGQAMSPGGKTAMTRSTSDSNHSMSGRRFSQAFGSSAEGPGGADIQTIQEMLEAQPQDLQASSEFQSANPPKTGMMTFDRSRPPAEKAAPAFYGSPTLEASPSSTSKGFFSLPLSTPESSPFFADQAQASAQRRSSLSVTSMASVSADRQVDASASSRQSQRGPRVPAQEYQNDSANTKGTGLPDPSRAPVGQPQTSPRTANFVDRPGPASGQEATATFSTVKSRVRSPKQSPAPSSGHESDQEKRDTSQAGLKQPTPQHLRVGGLPGLGESSKRSKDTESRTSGGRTTMEIDENGIKQLIGDFSDIIRLGDGTNTASDTGTRPVNSAGSAQSQSFAAISAKADRRRTSRSNPQESVSRFVNDQANTVNMADPNAPNPSPFQSSDDDTADSDSFPDRSDNRSAPSSGVGPSDRRRRAPPSNPSQAGLSQESSEYAAASGEEEGASEALPSEQAEEEEPVATFRFEYQNTRDGHHVMTGREGRLRRCEDEPITTPGAVQGFGVLIVLEEDYQSGDLVVRQVSENATELLGLSPQYLFKLDCFSRILPNDQEDILRDSLEYLPEPGRGRGSVEEEGPSVFLLSGYGEPGTHDTIDEDTASDVSMRRMEWTCWVAAHRPAAPADWDEKDENGVVIPSPELIILEFELERDIYNPLMQNGDGSRLLGRGVFRSSGPDTPESGTSGSGGSGRAPLLSRSGTGSADSATTVASTPRPGGGAGSNVSGPSDSSQTGTIHGGGEKGGTAHSHSGALSSLARPPIGSRTASEISPQGLEGLHVELPFERILESTTNHAMPLRALERLRRHGMPSEPGSDDASSRPSSSRRGGAAGRARRGGRRGANGRNTGTMDIFAVLGQINEQLGSAADLETFLKVTVGVVQDLCRFHRVLLYQFDESYNGQVVAELVEWGKTTDLFKGLMFPAADIPAQARELYKINKVRLLYDRGQTTARMFLRSREDLKHPLDMTHCYLRAMSPIHIKYLSNMGVRSSMSVSIMAFGQLWGLIACHSYGNSGMRVSFPVRQMMRLMSDSISKNIERLSYAQRLHTRKLISTIPSQAHPTGYIVSNADDLLNVFDADSGLLVIGEGCRLLGNKDQGQAMLAIAEWLRVMRFPDLTASSNLGRDFPDLVLPRANDTIAGMLYVPLTAKAGQDFIVFLRKGQVKEVQWAGKPYKDVKAGEDASLEPRKSFNTWSETVIGRARAWSDDQLESAGVLALIYGKFIHVWREKQSAMASNQLTAILLSNTSHAVRTPLSQIINTLELALAGNLDKDTRTMLENSHQASRALLFHVHDLLDLTRIETGNETAFNDPFDIRKVIEDAVRLYRTESSRRGLDFRMMIAEDLPKQVIGDSRKIKTVLGNLVANAVKYTETGFIEIHCGVQGKYQTITGPVQEGGSPTEMVSIEFIICDSGCGMSTETLAAMFVTLEGAEDIGNNPRGPAGLGLGLAVVARIVEQLAGQLRAESEVGVGSRFFFAVEMPIATDRSVSTQSRKSANQVGLVIPRAGTNSSAGSVARFSAEGASNESAGRMSEIDSFVQDFGASHMSGPNYGTQGQHKDRRVQAAEDRMSKPGTFPVTDSSWPIRATRMTDDNNSNENNSAGSVTSDGQPNLIQAGQPTSPPRMIRRSTTHAADTVVSPRSSPRLDRGGSTFFGGASGEDIRPSNTTTVTQSPSPNTVVDTKSETPSPRDPDQPPRRKRTSKNARPSDPEKLRILVVEDDAINSQILQKRVRMDKHSVIAVTNGQEAVDLLKLDWDFDVVLMDIQMPIMDGRTAAKEIRKLEHLPDHPSLESFGARPPHRVDGRIPIFAVSASLYESDRESLSQHFDGYLLKPLDFQRVRALLNGLHDEEVRYNERYIAGRWERGGYLNIARNVKTPSRETFPDSARPEAPRRQTSQ